MPMGLVPGAGAAHLADRAVAEAARVLAAHKGSAAEAVLSLQVTGTVPGAGLAVLTQPALALTVSALATGAAVLGAIVNVLVVIAVVVTAHDRLECGAGGVVQLAEVALLNGGQGAAGEGVGKELLGAMQALRNRDVLRVLPGQVALPDEAAVVAAELMRGDGAIRGHNGRFQELALGVPLLLQHGLLLLLPGQLLLLRNRQGAGRGGTHKAVQDILQAAATTEAGAVRNAGNAVLATGQVAPCVTAYGGAVCGASACILRTSSTNAISTKGGTVSRACQDVLPAVAVAVTITAYGWAVLGAVGRSLIVCAEPITTHRGAVPGTVGDSFLLGVAVVITTETDVVVAGGVRPVRPAVAVIIEAIDTRGLAGLGVAACPHLSMGGVVVDEVDDEARDGVIEAGAVHHAAAAAVVAEQHRAPEVINV
mmetsp:Transcript_11015/g.23764  ORF Transcript_11015/g.23764 Transcript_11015/m.23764 type:complete len:424 (-) Transcript_11015:1567-2838(-)